MEGKRATIRQASDDACSCHVNFEAHVANGNNVRYCEVFLSCTLGAALISFV